MKKYGAKNPILKSFIILLINIINMTFIENKNFIFRIHMNTCFNDFKNKHKGKRVFLIGNGPSLGKTDLNLIKNEYSIAMNRISLIYENTDWRPSYYLFCSSNCDHPVWGKAWTNSILTAINEEKTIPFIWSKYKNTIDRENKLKKIKWFHSVSEKKPDTEGNINPICFSNNIIERIDKTGTTMNVALQLAKHMGFSEIIVIGADLGWKADDGKTNSDPNHFCKDYSADIPAYKLKKINNQMRNIHKLARKNFNNEVRMYNATLTTKLDIYPLIDYNKLLLENKYEERKDEQEKLKLYWHNLNK